MSPYMELSPAYSYSRDEVVKLVARIHSLEASLAEASKQDAIIAALRKENSDLRRQLAKLIWVYNRP